MPTVTGPDLCHCLASRRAARMLSRIYDRHLAPVSLNISQFALLSFISQQPGIGAAPLAAKMAMERTTLVRALQPLRAAGLVEAHRDGGKDLRYQLSREGELRLMAATPYWEAAQAEHEGQFGAERSDALRSELLDLTRAA